MLSITYSVDGSWGKWSAWSTCTKTCKQGKQSRKRTCEDKTSVPEVFSSFSCIPRTRLETFWVHLWSVAMVTRDDAISSRWSSLFWVKIQFFLTSFNNKSKYVAKIIQSDYVCVIFHVKHTKKKLFLAILTWFVILGKIQDSDHCWWRHRPRAAPSPIKYTGGGGGGYEFACTFEGWVRVTWYLFISVDGDWGEWGAWSKCSKSCGGGEHARVRQCNSPAPAYGGKPCKGPFRQRRLCNKENCPGMVTAW